MSKLPGGSDFANTRPVMTLAAARSGKDRDKYRYSGKFTPNRTIEGTWQWVLWPPPKNPEDIDGKINQWLKGWTRGGKKSITKKDMIELLDGGRVSKSGYFKGYFWSDDMLVSPQIGVALNMVTRTVDGYDFLLIEKGGFDKANGSKDWHCGFHGYVRVGKDKKTPLRKDR
jgi:hypothetical protein